MSTTSFTLYYDKHTRAGRVRWLLEELGLDYELVVVSLATDENKQPAHLRRHPLGKVPALRVGDHMMIESGAMLVYLADEHSDGGFAVPVESPARAEYLQWIFFAGCSLEPGLVQHWYHTQGWDEEARSSAQAAIGLENFHAAARVVADHVADREYMVDGRFTAADIAIGSVLGMARGFGFLDQHPPLIDYGRRVGSRAAAKRARAD